ncbi:uncharacterized protein LOC132309269 [Cornus florida]|uniref:uncharacterized protein LOC132309269 n=1 Tax=Cornus florida TaxID=4283 RepID=UPI00289AF19D|nr:uncharacterized protein LOC132309269 [Cornus florida]
MTLEEFKTLFFDCFFLRAMRQNMRVYFTGLYQGMMSVIEYETRFTSLSRYALEMVATDELRARKFQDGLHLDIRQWISVLDLRTYGVVFQKATLVEAEDRDQLRIKGSYKQSHKEASLVSVGDQWKKAKAEDSSRVQGQLQQAQSVPTVPIPLGKLICHHYQQPGHIKPRCPQLQPQGSRSQIGKSSTSMQGSRELVITVSSLNILRRSVHAYKIEHRVALVHRPYQHSLQLFSLGSSQQSEAPGRAYALPQADTSAGTSTVRDLVCRGCAIEIAGQILEFDFIIFDMTGYDVILGMDWLSFFCATINCFHGRVSVRTPTGECFHFVGDWSDSHSTMIFCISDWSCHRSYLDSLLADEDSGLGHVYPIVVVKFLDVFPEELTELPPLREVIFSIDVIPGTALISMAPLVAKPALISRVIEAQLEDGEIKAIHVQISVTDNAERLSGLYVRQIVKLYGVPTDGQLECTIQILEDMLQAYILDFSGSWEDYLLTRPVLA